MWSQFPPNLSCLQNNQPENNVEPLSSKSELPINNPPENNVEPVPAKFELPQKQSAGKLYNVVTFLLNQKRYSRLAVGRNENYDLKKKYSHLVGS
jgi:hypothetical protein